MRWRTCGRSAKRTTCWMSALPPSSAGCDFPATISWIGRCLVEQQPFQASPGSRSISVSRLYVGTRRANPMVSTLGSNAVAIQPNSASEAPRSSHDWRSRRRTSSTSSDRSCERIHHRWPASTCCSRSQTPGSLNDESDPASSRPSCNHCGAAQVRACTPLVIDPIGTSLRVESAPQLVEHGPAHPAVQQRNAVGPLRQPQAHVRHVELGRIVLGAERDDPGRRHARQQRRGVVPISRAAGLPSRWSSK